jgi:hypothetical protein
LESDDDDEYIFPFSPDAGNNTSKGKLPSTPPPHNIHMHSDELHGPITSIKEYQLALTSIDSSNTSLSGDVCQHSTETLESSDQMSDQRLETELSVIPEESQEQRGPEQKAV